MIHLNPNCSEYTFRVKIEGQNKENINKLVTIIKYIEKQTELGVDEEYIVKELNEKYKLEIENVDTEASFYKDEVFNIEHYKISGDCGDMGGWIGDILSRLDLEYEEEER